MPLPEPIVATPVAVLVQVPPLTVFVRFTVAPIQRVVDNGEIADGVTLTVIASTAEHPAAFV